MIVEKLKEGPHTSLKGLTPYEVAFLAENHGVEYFKYALHNNRGQFTSLLYQCSIGLTSKPAHPCRSCRHRQCQVDGYFNLISSNLPLPLMMKLYTSRMVTPGCASLRSDWRSRTKVCHWPSAAHVPRP